MFLLGLLLGSSLVMGYGLYQIKKIKKTKNALLGQIKTKILEEDKKKNSIKERLLQASELAQVQMSIKAQLEMPSKNALHSKYKNELISELQDIEQKKIEILQTILADGFDPVITMTNETGGKAEVPLSAYVNDALTTLGNMTGGQSQVQTPPPLPSDPTNPKRIGRFLVYKGGKDDKTTH